MGARGRVGLFLVCLLIVSASLAFLPQQVTAEGCCLDRTTGACTKESTYTSTAAYTAFCSTTNNRQPLANSVNAAGQCTGQCSTVCCCAMSDKAGVNWQSINQDEQALAKSTFACQQQVSSSPAGAYQLKTLSAGKTCVEICAGTSSSGPQTYTVSGSARYESSGAAVANAQVSITPPSGPRITGTTDANGRYTLSGVPAAQGLSVLIVPPTSAACPAYVDGPFAVTAATTRPPVSLSCTGGTACRPNAPTITVEPGQTATTRDITVNATNACQNFIGQTVYVCNDGQPCTRPSPIQPTASASTSQLNAKITATNVPAGQDNCFFTQAFFGPVSLNSTITCSRSAAAQCAGRPAGEQFCGTDQTGTPIVQQCDTNGQTSTVQTCTSNPPQTCVQAQSAAGTTARCVSFLCEGCNGVFGLYAEKYDLTVGGIACRNYKVGAPVQACTMSRAIGKPLLIDALESCAKTTSCADYTEPGSCGANRCGVEDKTTCRWATINAELGTGICFNSAVGAGAPCAKCSELFGACTPDLCTQIGTLTSSTCYYSDELGPSGERGCLAAQDMACMFYTTRADCVGTAGTSARVDTQYSGAAITTRNGTTNRITQRSADKLGLGICTWVVDGIGGDRCIKNADAWSPALPAIDDCADTAGSVDEGCLPDRAPPNTSISVLSAPYDVSAAAQIGLGAMDDIAPLTQVKTYGCFAVSGQTCYPKKLLSAGDGLPTPAQLPKGQTRSYAIFYYSDDGHGNLEVVKSAPIQLRGDGIPRLESVVVEENS